MQFFWTCVKYKGNSFKSGRLIVCSGWRKWLKHSAPAVTKRFRSPIILRVFILGIYMGSIQPAPRKITFFSLVRKTMRNVELPTWGIIYCSKIRQQNGACFFCRQLNGMCVGLSSCTQRTRCGFSLEYLDSGRYYNNKTPSFQSNVRL